MKHSVFALELCLRLEPGSALRSELRELVVNHPAVSDPGPKWELLRRVTELLVVNQHLFERGCWDFFDTDARALKDFDMWSKGMTTEEGARAEPSGSPNPYRQAPRYMTFTIALLLMCGTSCERQLAALCDFPEDQLWHIQTFVRILSGLNVVNFAFVKSDVLYLIPGDETWGLTAEDLQAEKFEYLRPLR